MSTAYTLQSSATTLMPTESYTVTITITAATSTKDGTIAVSAPGHPSYSSPFNGCTFNSDGLGSVQGTNKARSFQLIFGTNEVTCTIPAPSSANPIMKDPEDGQWTADEPSGGGWED